MENEASRVCARVYVRMRVQSFGAWFDDSPLEYKKVGDCVW